LRCPCILFFCKTAQPNRTKQGRDGNYEEEIQNLYRCFLKGDNSKPDSNMDADIEFIQKESNKSSETENKDFAENKV
jgi:hypothetical protein